MPLEIEVTEQANDRKISIRDNVNRDAFTLFFSPSSLENENRLYCFESSPFTLQISTRFKSQRSREKRVWTHTHLHVSKRQEESDKAVERVKDSIGSSFFCVVKPNCSSALLVFRQYHTVHLLQMHFTLPVKLTSSTGCWRSTMQFIEEES